MGLGSALRVKWVDDDDDDAGDGPVGVFMIRSMFLLLSLYVMG